MRGLLLHPDLPPLGATHDGIEARVFARIAVAASPAIEALIGYAAAEATALLPANRDIVDDLVSALIEAGDLSGESADEYIEMHLRARLRPRRSVVTNARITNAKTFQQVVVQ
jgi:hypothetical protein